MSLYLGVWRMHSLCLKSVLRDLHAGNSKSHFTEGLACAGWIAMCSRTASNQRW